MGKKRRLNSAKAKFRAKHSNHPRARLLRTTEAADAPAIVETPTIMAATAETEAVLTAAVEDSIAEAIPEVVVPVKKTRRATKKRTKRTSS